MVQSGKRAGYNFIENFVFRWHVHSELANSGTFRDEGTKYLEKIAAPDLMG